MSIYINDKKIAGNYILDENIADSPNAVKNSAINKYLNNNSSLETTNKAVVGSINELNSNKLSLSGGTISGDLNVGTTSLNNILTVNGNLKCTDTLIFNGNQNVIIARTSDNIATEIRGASTWTKGAYMYLAGKDNTSKGSGVFGIVATDGTTSKELLGKPDGTLNWGGKKIAILQELYDGIFPIGFIYAGITCPGVPSGVTATWTEQTTYNGRYLKIDSTKSAGTSVAESITVAGTAITVNQMPKHSHERGTMEIVGSLGDFFCQNNMTQSGALSHTRTNTYTYQANPNVIYFEKINFKASDGWTGSTSEVGGGQTHTHDVSNIKPMATTIKVWKRTA